GWRRRCGGSWFFRALKVGEIVMGAKGAFRNILPIALADLFVAVRMERIMEAAASPRRLAHYQEADIASGVVDEGVGKAGARRKADPIAGFQALDVAIKP